MDYLHACTEACQPVMLSVVGEFDKFSTYVNIIVAAIVIHLWWVGGVVVRTLDL